MEKVYNPSEFESKIYETWLGKKYFSAKIDKNKKRKYCVECRQRFKNCAQRKQRVSVGI